MSLEAMPRISDPRHVARRSHLHRKLLEGLSAPELKGFKRALSSPGLQAFHGQRRLHVPGIRSPGPSHTVSV